MTTLIIFTFIIILLVGSYALVSLSNVGWRRFAGPSLLLVVGALLCLGYINSLGSPRPIWLPATISSGQVVAVVYNEGVAIYVWVQGESPEPVAITIPWTEEAAKEIREAEVSGEESGGVSFNSEDTESPIHPRPVISYPSKEE